MSEGDLLGTGKGPPHLGHHRALSKATEERLAALGERIPPMSEEEIKSIARERTARILRHMAVLAVVLVVMLAVVLAGVQWLRPLPPPTFRAAVGSAPPSGNTSVVAAASHRLRRVVGGGRRQSRPIPKHPAGSNRWHCDGLDGLCHPQGPSARSR